MMMPRRGDLVRVLTAIGLVVVGIVSLRDRSGMHAQPLSRHCIGCSQAEINIQHDSELDTLEIRVNALEQTKPEVIAAQMRDLLESNSEMRRVMWGIIAGLAINIVSGLSRFSLVRSPPK